VFSPCVGIVPYTGFFGPKPGLPLTGMAANENHCFQIHQTKRTTLKPPKLCRKKVLYYLLRTSSSSCSTRRVVGEHRRVRGMKEVYDLRRKGKHYRGMRCSPLTLA
jgi:hypothetical protein